MPVDASIFQQYLRPPKSVLEYQADYDQADARKNALQLAAMDLDEKRRGLAGDNALARLLAGGGDVAQGLASEGYGKQSMAYIKAQQDALKQKAEIGHVNAQTGELGAKTMNLYMGQARDALGTVNDPQAAASWVAGLYSAPELASLVKMSGKTMEQAIASIPSDPAGFAQWKMRSQLGAEKMMQYTMPDANTQANNAQSGLNNTNTVNATMRGQDITSSTTQRGQNMVDSRSRAAQSQAEAHFQAGQTAPQYMETDAGLVALPKKLAPGQVPTGVSVAGADGQPLGKPLKAIPATVNSAMIQNSQSVGQIDRALKLLGGTSTDGMTGDQSATGIKGYLPNGLLNRMDPQGVDARAIISDIGSLKIHDRSGAAVTVSESPRLMPFIPLSTDDAVTVKKKLNKLRVELATESQAMQTVYSREQGYKPSPISPAANNQLAAHGLPAGWSVKAN